MPNLLSYAVPFFLLLVILEAIFAAWDKKDLYETKDTISSLTMGVGNFFSGLLTKLFAFGVYTLVYEFRIFEIGYVWWAWVIIFFAEDFSYYWFHRVSHSSRYFWASHVVHHSSKKYNLSTALRQTWTGQLSGTFVFWLWLPLLGFPPVMVMTQQAISLIYQFWIHTEVIDKLPKPIEYIFNTPSHHRVHHSSDVEYLDKNHAGILIIWDRLFGTFEEEKRRPTYGLVTNINTHNPVKIAFVEWWNIGKDIIRSPRHTLGYLFGPPGWSHDGSRKTTAQLREELKNKN